MKMMDKLLGLTGLAVAGMTGATAHALAQVPTVLIDPTGLFDHADRVAGMGMATFLMLICFALCFVVLRLFYIVRSDSKAHHEKRDEVQAALMALVKECASAIVSSTDTNKAVLSELHDLNRRPL